MGKEYTEIDERIQKWIKQQRVFFVATAPLADDGLINCSPKGLDSLAILGPRQLAYLDVGGSGIETVAHLKQNGRIVLMLCAFDGPPTIYRFYGIGTVVEPHQAKFDDLLGKFPTPVSVRNIIVIDVERIMDSCGYGVPEYAFVKDRDSMRNHYASSSDEEDRQYRRNRNAKSLDGLPGLDVSKLSGD
jgi:hypothetical protein